MTTTPSKLGRKNKFHTFSGDNLPVVGLCKDKGKRWRIALGPQNPLTGKRFTEVDERLAIATFYRLTGGSSIRQLLGQPGPVFTMGQAEQPANGMVLSRVGVGLGAAALVWAADGFEATSAKSGVESMPINLDCPEVWAFVRQSVVERPRYVAGQTGIEEIGYLTKLGRPEAIPTLKELGEAYFTRADICAKELHNSRSYWNLFRKLVSVKHVDELTPAIFLAYADALKGKGLAGSSQSRHIGKVRSILAAALKRGSNQATLRKALDAAACMSKPKATKVDPHPIASADFAKLYKVADVQWQAILLLSLNAALYASEACGLRWGNLDLATNALSATRHKTGLPRTAVLWPQTVAALKLLPRDPDRDNLFTAPNGRAMNADNLRWAFKALRQSAGVGEIQFNQLRDGALTAAAAAGVEQLEVDVLAGQRAPGVTDHYVRRAAGLTARACAAVGEAYGVAKLAE